MQESADSASLQKADGRVMHLGTRSEIVAKQNQLVVKRELCHRGACAERCSHCGVPQTSTTPHYTETHICDRRSRAHGAADAVARGFSIANHRHWQSTCKVLEDCKLIAEVFIIYTLEAPGPPAPA